jgi:hypothetical protein
MMQLFYGSQKAKPAKATQQLTLFWAILLRQDNKKALTSMEVKAFLWILSILILVITTWQSIL